MRARTEWRQEARGKRQDADKDVLIVQAGDFWLLTGHEARSIRQEAYREVTIARLAQEVWPGDVFCSS